MVRSYQEAQRRLATATQYVPIKLTERNRRLGNTHNHRIWKYRFIPQYVSPFVLDQLEAKPVGYDWIADEIKAAELSEKLPNFSYSIYRDLYWDGISQEEMLEEYPSFLTVRATVRKYIEQLVGLVEEEEEEYNGFNPGRVT